MFWLLIKCCCCRCGGARHRRQGSGYNDDNLNWVYACDDCLENEINPYWRDMWDDYNRGRL